MGSRHQNYGAEEAHYLVVKQVIFWTLAHKDLLGNDFNNVVKTAWEAGYNIIAHMMLRGQYEGKQGVTYKEEPDNKKCIIM